MRARAAVFVLSLLLTLSLAADLTPGAAVAEGRALPRVGDVNGDGLSDLIESRSVLLNQGGGTFVRHDLGIGNDIVADWIDVNGDGRADLLAYDAPMSAPTAPPGKRSYRIYLAGDDLDYGIPYELPISGYEPYIANVNADGNEDLVLMRAIHNGPHAVAMEVRVLLSLGNGTFTAREPFRIAPDPQHGSTRRLLAGDLNNDAIADLVFRTPHELVVLLGTGGGDFPVETRYLPMHFGFWATQLGDIDGDGNLDFVMASVRTIRVYFGDGRGRFTRVASTPLLKKFEPALPAHIAHLDLDRMQAPRNLQLGAFVAAGRMEIAGGTAEGELVIVAWENGKLQEVARSVTEYVMPDVYAGAFRERGHRELFVTWVFRDAAGHPVPRIFETTPEPLAAASARRAAGRTRAVRHLPAPNADFDVQARGECVPAASEALLMSRDGLFGGGRSLEAYFDGDSMYFRFAPAWAHGPIYGQLSATENGYEGTAMAATACGEREVRFTATAQ